MVAIAQAGATILVAFISVVAVVMSAVGAHVFRVRQWRYERQHDAYAHFLDVWSLTAAAQVLIHDDMVDKAPEHWPEQFRPFRETATTFFEAFHRIELVASEDVTKHASTLHDIYNVRAGVLSELLRSGTHDCGWDDHIAATMPREAAARNPLVRAARRDIRATGKSFRRIGR